MKQDVDHSAVKAILNVLRKKIARRTSEDAAAFMLSKFIEELKPKYEFLKYISINQSIYSESDSIWVAPELNQANGKQVFSALNELMEKSVAEMKEKADFYFIREFQVAFENIDEIHRSEIDDAFLDEMQHEYLVRRTHTLSLEKNQLLINVIHSLLSIINTSFSEKKSVELMEQSLLELLPKFPFFHSIDIIKNPETKGYYNVEISESVQKIPTYLFADSINYLMIKIGTKLSFKNPEQFRMMLKQKLGKRNIELLRKLSIPIDNLSIVVSTITKKDIMHRVIDSIIIIIGNRTSHYFAVAVIIKLINDVKKTHILYETIQLQKTNETYSLTFLDGIESSTDEQFRKSIKALIEAVGTHLGAKKKDFIKELKKRLGNEYVSLLEKKGFNFHILEMKFN